MINKKSLWFLTLFSLILVLSIYYITMPSELMLTNTENLKINEESEKTEAKVTTEDSDILVALRVDADEAMSKEIEDLQVVLTNPKSSVNEKNDAYQKIKELNSTRGEEEKLEGQIKDAYDLSSYVKIENSGITITIKKKDHTKELANNIMRTIQANYKESKYIVVKFQK